jgi:hypothetical protein
VAATYDPMLPTDRDWVRLLSGDRDVDRPVLQDEEIDELVVGSTNKFFAAAAACEVIYSRMKGAIEKQVGDLKIKYGTTARDAYSAYIQKLRERGALATSPHPQAGFRVL